ncbi:hypothetical protein GE09DRAFT_341144 [Coniochaeta sp. 2T2.1]|nr:hypothetical protein GE09DRAFT_341144 [Coniochaeta sp. 2T2.1]
MDSSSVHVDAVMAMTDQALAAFMIKNRHPDGNIDLPVHGWDKLSKKDRDGLAKRLQAQQKALAQSPPLDVAQLDARLRDVSSSNPSGTRRPDTERLRSPSPPFDPVAATKGREREAYDKLVKDGGRPLYPITLLDRVFESPDEYSHLLQPWDAPFPEFARCDTGPTSYRGQFSGPEQIFQGQLSRWEEFRTWQRNHRLLEDDEKYGFPAYVTQCKESLEGNLDEDYVARSLAEIEADPSTVKYDWDQMQRIRAKERRHYRESDAAGSEFSDYVDAVKRRLARHGFTRPFLLDRDPKQQDPLSTWIEYLYYEYWWLDRFTSIMERDRPKYEAAWQKLVALGVLHPRHTHEYICSPAIGFESQADKDRAWQAIQRARQRCEELERTTTEVDPNRLRIPEQKRIQMLQDATRDLQKAEHQLAWYKRRFDLVVQCNKESGYFTGAKEAAARHELLLPWILEQIPIIEAELSHVDTVQGIGSVRVTRSKRRREPDDEGSSAQEASKKRKLGRHDDADVSEKAGERRAAMDAEHSVPLGHGRHGAEATVTPPLTEQSMARSSPTARKVPPQMLRRSARIAARLRGSSRALPPQPCQEGTQPQVQAMEAPERIDRAKAFVVGKTTADEQALRHRKESRRMRGRRSGVT